MKEYKKGNLRGYVYEYATGRGRAWLAETGLKSSTFKTMSGAERFMERMGYNPVN
jgi:hypothetical protein